MYWGPKYTDLWEQRVKEMEKQAPAHLFFCNEPDVTGQCDMTPSSAAKLFMEQINPWRYKHTKVCSPAIVWDIDWLVTFLGDIEKMGGSVDFICLHWSVL
jgi:hypothetical protein